MPTLTDPITPEITAALVAENTTKTFAANQKTYWNLKSNGAPAQTNRPGQPDRPAFTGDQYIAAMGTANIAVLDAAYGAAAPTT